RLLLARVFLEGANVLVLDEPTNDLDIVTLNVLESLLASFRGTVLLVTHDRYFLDKVATAILAFEGDGKVVRYEGNYSMYRRLRQPSAPGPTPAPDGRVRAEPPQPATAKPKAPGRLSYKDQRELDAIESTIEQAEAHKAGLEQELANPATYARPPSEVAALQQTL